MQPADAAMLEQAYVAFSSCQVKLGLDNDTYDVDFIRMLRRNMRNSKERSLRRLAPPAAADIAAGHPSAPARWEVLRDNWQVPSDPRDQERLETAYTTTKHCMLEVAGRQYVVDIEQMQQTNQETGHARKLHRAPLTPYSGLVPSGQIATGGPKRVVLVRHGEGVHNQTKNYSLVDPPLTQKGVDQAKSLQGNPLFEECQLLVVTPLQRAVHTAATVFGERPNCRTVITALHTERWSAKCDEGRPKGQLLADFPYVTDWQGWADLSGGIWWGTPATDANWQNVRLPAFCNWLRAQPEQHIVVVGHGGFFAPLAGKHMNNCEALELKV